MTNPCALNEQVVSSPEWLVLVVISCGLSLFWFVYLRLLGAFYWAVWQKLLYGLIALHVAFLIYVCLPLKRPLELVLSVFLALVILQLVFCWIAQMRRLNVGVLVRPISFFKANVFNRIKRSLGESGTHGWICDIVTLVGCLCLICLIWNKAKDCTQKANALAIKRTIEEGAPVTLGCDSALGPNRDGEAGEKEVASRLLWPIIGSVTGLVAFMGIRHTLREVLEMRQVELHSSIKVFQSELLSFLSRCLERSVFRQNHDGAGVSSGEAQRRQSEQPIFLAVAHILPPGWLTDSKAANEVMELLKNFTSLPQNRQPKILVFDKDIMARMISDIAGENAASGFMDFWRQFDLGSVPLFVPRIQAEQIGGEEQARLGGYAGLPHLHVYVSRELCEALIAVPIGGLPWLAWASNWVLPQDGGRPTATVVQSSNDPTYAVLVVRTRQRREVDELWDQVQRMIRANLGRMNGYHNQIG